jgi:hypothetical protein
MLNIGQVVYDTTNDRVLLFCGMEMYSSKKSVDKQCFVLSAFIDENGTVLEHDSRTNERKFEYTNLVKNGRPYAGTAITELRCNGHYFGIMDYDKTEVKDAAIKAIQAMKEEIAIHGITKKAIKGSRGEYTTVTIGKEVEKESQLAVSIVPQ